LYTLIIMSSSKLYLQPLFSVTALHIYNSTLSMSWPFLSTRFFYLFLHPVIFFNNLCILDHKFLWKYFCVYFVFLDSCIPLKVLDFLIISLLVPFCAVASFKQPSCSSD
jgi:hypothetical protein